LLAKGELNEKAAYRKEAAFLVLTGKGSALLRFVLQPRPVGDKP